MELKRSLFSYLNVDLSYSFVKQGYSNKYVPTYYAFKK